MAKTRYINIDFPFKDSNKGFYLNLNQTDRDAIRADLLHLLLTNKGERVFNPNFGADLRALLFENIDDTSLDDLTTIIQTSISNYFPQITVKEIKFENQVDENTINFILTYEIVLFNIEDTVNILLQ